MISILSKEVVQNCYLPKYLPVKISIKKISIKFKRMIP